MDRLKNLVDDGGPEYISEDAVHEAIAFSHQKIETRRQYLNDILSNPADSDLSVESSPSSSSIDI